MFCSETPGSPWPVAVGFRGLQAEKNINLIKEDRMRIPRIVYKRYKSSDKSCYQLQQHAYVGDRICGIVIVLFLWYPSLLDHVCVNVFVSQCGSTEAAPNKNFSPGSYYTKKHRGGCTKGLFWPGHLITNQTRSVRLVIRC